MADWWRTVTIARFDPLQAKSMPPKRHRKHRWVAITTAAAWEGVSVFLGVASIAEISIGCLDCEEPYSEVCAEPCTAPAFDWIGGT